MKAARIDWIERRAMAWDEQFTFRVDKLPPGQARARVTNAWLAGYRAAQDAARKRRTTKNRGDKHG